MTAKITNLNTDDIISQYLAGIPEQKLAQLNGVSRYVIARVLREGGINRRNISEANTLRMQRMTPSERGELTRAAHIAATGRIHTRQEKGLRAITNARRMIRVAPIENDLAKWLGDRAVEIRQQAPIGPYNLDIAIDSPPIAVEIFGGGWHAYGSHAIRHLERTKYLLNLGWSVVIIWVDGRRYPLRESVCDYLLTLMDELRQEPAISSQYRVILGDGNLAPPRRIYLNDLSTIEALGSRYQIWNGDGLPRK